MKQSWPEFQNEVHALFKGVFPNPYFWGDLELFRDIFLEQAKKFNLMGPGGLENILTDHFYDCLSGFPHMNLKPGLRFLDLGTGGGFPGILLKLYEPGLDLGLVESKGKKVSFLKEAIRILDYPDIKVHQLGIENVSKSPEFKNQFDGITARGLADMEVLLKWSAPLLKPKLGKCYFYKAANWESELRARAREKHMDSISSVDLKHHGLERKLVIKAA